MCAAGRRSERRGVAVRVVLAPVKRRGQSFAPTWELSRVVRELRAARAPERTRRSGRAGELPSHEALGDVMEGLRAALFPQHFGPRELNQQSVDYFVGHTLNATLNTLFAQTRRALAMADERASEDSDESAHALVRAFAAELPRIRALLQSDVQAALDGDPAATSLDEVVFCYPGITAVTHHRVAHALHNLGAPLLARIIAEQAHSQTGIDIHPGAQIGRRFFIDHGTGVVIGETSILGANVRLYQGVTLGAKSVPNVATSPELRLAPRHPILEDDVVIYAGATVLGRVTIGRGATIGGNVWVTQSVPPGTRVTQSQQRASAFAGGAGI